MRRRSLNFLAVLGLQRELEHSFQTKNRSHLLPLGLLETEATHRPSGTNSAKCSGGKPKSLEAKQSIGLTSSRQAQPWLTVADPQRLWQPAKQNNSPISYLFQDLPAIWIQLLDWLRYCHICHRISVGTSRTILGLGCHAPNSSAGFGLATLLLPNPGVVAAPWNMENWWDTLWENAHLHTAFIASNCLLQDDRGFPPKKMEENVWCVTLAITFQFVSRYNVTK